MAKRVSRRGDHERLSYMKWTALTTLGRVIVIVAGICVVSIWGLPRIAEPFAGKETIVSIGIVAKASFAANAALCLLVLRLWKSNRAYRDRERKAQHKRRHGD